MRIIRITLFIGGIVFTIMVAFILFFTSKTSNQPYSQIFDLKHFTFIDGQNKSTGIYDITKNKPFLVFRFTERNCDLCVNFELQFLKNINYFKINDSFILLTTTNNERPLYFMKKSYGIDRVIIAKTNNENIVIDSLNIPYYFVIDTCLKARDIFIPDKTKPEITEKYLRVVAERYSFDRK